MPLTAKLLIALVGLQALSGIGGGVGLVVGPKGEVLQMPLEFLEGTPFADYLVPGLILLIVLGLFAALVFYGLAWRPRWAWTDFFNRWTGQHWSWSASLVLGIGLTIWIVVEMIMIRQVAAIQVLYLALGALILAVALLPPTRHYYRTRAV